MEHSKDYMKLQGEACWAELYSDDADATIKFLGDNLGIEVATGSEEGDTSYRTIKSKEGLFPYGRDCAVRRKA